MLKVTGGRWQSWDWLTQSPRGSHCDAASCPGRAEQAGKQALASQGTSVSPAQGHPDPRAPRSLWRRDIRAGGRRCSQQGSGRAWTGALWPGLGCFLQLLHPPWSRGPSQGSGMRPVCSGWTDRRWPDSSPDPQLPLLAECSDTGAGGPQTSAHLSLHSLGLC